VLRPLNNLFNPAAYPQLLVGLSVADDAAVYQLDADRALVLTTDFFTPIVDDPYDYGAIAASNALSDVYAMGGEPLLALNLVAFPPQLPPQILSEVLRGGAEAVRAAGAVIAGGHTIQDKEPKYGLAVVGLVRPDQLLTKGGARPGDLLILTKPLGSGVIATAFKSDKADAADLAEAVASMKRLNRTAAALAREFGLRAATDVTGFGLLGHAWEMAEASGVRFRLRLNDVPLFSAAPRYADQWLFPGGAYNNLTFYRQYVQSAPDLPQERLMLLYDPQTSGGLLMAVPPERGDELLRRAARLEQSVWVIGDVVAGNGIVVL